MAAASLNGRLLVAVPTLPDPNFHRAVVLVLEHGDEGAVGLVLNRPTETDLPEQLPGWGLVATDPAVVFLGGPVAPDAAIGLARARNDPADDGFLPLIDGLGTVDLSRSPDDAAPSVTAVRVFVGYAGWGAGQLDAEVAAGDWIVLDAEPGDAFADEPEELWRRVLRRQGGRLGALARFPDDLSLN